MREQVLTYLSQNVPPERVNHILRVEQTAADLAAVHNLDKQKAAAAGLMHDLAKCFKPQRLLHMAREEGLTLDEILETNPHLLHADVSAIVARDTFGVEDEQVLNAISNHTLGSTDMSLLSCIVFLADSIEPGRGDSASIQALRQASQENIYKAVYLTCNHTLEKLLDSPRLIHPRLIATRNKFLIKCKY
ncbi:MAG: bis(5'-nucleosyl)-tetraphosphatase (symmetrical) YqeK [Cyanobacteriota bacterium]|nr:bis(5'-nucleosyl)-tetraphosphatase (symmetrical) YqeK [Cyanobacteriota bacterium]